MKPSAQEQWNRTIAKLLTKHLTSRSTDEQWRWNFTKNNKLNTWNRCHRVTVLSTATHGRTWSFRVSSLSCSHGCSCGSIQSYRRSAALPHALYEEVFPATVTLFWKRTTNLQKNGIFAKTSFVPQFKRAKLYHSLTKSIHSTGTVIMTDIQQLAPTIIRLFAMFEINMTLVGNQQSWLWTKGRYYNKRGPVLWACPEDFLDASAIIMQYRICLG